MSKFLLLLGSSGVGKSSIIKKLIQLDKRFTYISPYITRPLRDGETDKVSIDDAQMNEKWDRGELLVINQLYSIRYATPRLPIVKSLADGNFPVLDWPISHIAVMQQAFPNQIYAVYISPPSIEILCKRLKKDGRDQDGSRLQNALKELDDHQSSRHVGICDFDIVSEEDRVERIAQSIYSEYLKSFF